MTFKRNIIALTIGAVMLAGCSNTITTTDPINNQLTSTDKKTIASIKKTVSQQQITQESAKANQLFELVFEENLMASPMAQTYMGIKKDYGKWDQLTEQQEQLDHATTKANLLRLKAINPQLLDQQTLLSYTLFKKKLTDDIAGFKWRYHNYPVNQMHGFHAGAVSFLINAHRITDITDAHAYISRLNGMKTLMLQLTDSLKIREDKGVMAPYFVYDHVISDSINIISGAPFDKKADSPLLSDFKTKIAKLDITSPEKSELISQAEVALLTNVRSGYSTLISYLREQQSRASHDDGAWKFPQGDEFYQVALQKTTTTDLTAEQIHQLGLDEVTRIHGEMRQIMSQVNFKGDLSEFFDFMRDDPRFYYPSNEEGKQQYLAQATKIINTMKGRLDELFIVKPKADLVVKQVEAFREKSAGKAFYNRPAPDGSRPGYYYANLYDMKDMPKYQMEALAFHEGIPGHHMQIAIAMELENVPKFRKYGHYTAYSEGWGLYSEFLPKEIGFYQDPYSDFGRLAMELWRACRLVVDTGLHDKRWTREQAISYLSKNTPNPIGDVTKAIERYIVMPSQATAYKIGMLKILELRQLAKDKLGAKFSIKEFHDVILKNGPVPLNILQQQVEKYIAKTL